MCNWSEGVEGELRAGTLENVKTGTAPQFQGGSHLHVSYLNASFHSCINTKAVLNPGR